MFRNLTNRVLVLVSVDSSIHDSSKEIIHDASQGLSIKHAMQSSYKHCVTGVKPLRRAANIVTVRDHPWNHLHLKDTWNKEVFEDSYSLSNINKRLTTITTITKKQNENRNPSSCIRTGVGFWDDHAVNNKAVYSHGRSRIIAKRKVIPKTSTCTGPSVAWIAHLCTTRHHMDKGLWTHDKPVHRQDWNAWAKSH